MQTPEMIGSHKQPLATPMPVTETNGPSVGLGPVMGPSWQSMGPPVQHIGPPVQHIGPFGQHIGPFGQHMGPFGQHMGPSWPQIGSSWQYMGHPGSTMGPTGPNTGFLGMNGSQMGSLAVPPIPQVQISFQIPQSAIPNYSSPLSNLQPVQPVNQPADDLWVKATTPTGQVYYYNTKTGISSWERSQNVTQTQQDIVYNMVAEGSTETDRNMATEASQAQTIVQQNAAAKDVKTDSEVSSDELEEEEVEETKKKTEIIEEKKSESKAEQKPVTKSRPVASTPIPGTVWRVVQTDDGKHFFYNPTKRQSVWKMPEELKNRPDVEKILPPKSEVKTEIKKEKNLQEEPPSKKIKLEAEVKEEKSENNNKVAQQTVLEKNTTKTVKVQTAENMPVVSLEDRKKQFRELLAENNVKITSTWERELHKIVFDKRYKLLTLQESKQVFEDYMKERAEEECQKRLRVKGNSELYRPSLEESNLIVKLEVEVKEEKEESSCEATQEIVLEKETTNAVKVQTAENMPVVSLEDRKKQFKELLAEKNVLTPPTRLKELCNIVFDNSSMLLTRQERKQTFAEYMKARGEEEHKKRYGQIKGNAALFRQLLEESNLNAESTFKGFTDEHSHDKRYFPDRKYMFEDYISMLAKQEKEINELFREEVKYDFMKMLSETPGIDQYTMWPDVRRKLYLDPRYKAVSDDSHRKDWFCAYLRTEKDVRGDFLKMLSEIPDINPSTSWGDVKNKVSSDPRFKDVSDTRQEEWFKAYLKTVKDVKYDFMKMLSETPGIAHYTLWSDVKSQLCLDPRYKSVADDSRRKNWFCAYLRAENDVRGDFMKILSEIPGINHSTKWSDVKNKVSSDPRYKAVSDTRQEEWFKKYVKTVKDATSDDIKNKEEQDKSLLSSSLKAKDESGQSHGEAAVKDFKKCSVEKPPVQDPAILATHQDPSIVKMNINADLQQMAPALPRADRETGIIDKMQVSYGFIQCCDRDARVFFHYSEYNGSMETLMIGEPVEFQMSFDQRTDKPMAVDVVKVKPSVVLPEILSEKKEHGTIVQEAKQLEQKHVVTRSALLATPKQKRSALLPPPERKLTLVEILKNRTEKERMKRYRKIEGNPELFRQLLEESNLNVNSTFQSFHDAHLHDERFGMVRYFRHKKCMFQDYINALAQQEKETFMSIRKKVTSDDVRKIAIQEKLLPSSSVKRENTSKQNAAFEDFKQFLVENVKDTKELFHTFKARFFQSPRWTIELSHKEKQNLYEGHVHEIHKKNRTILGSILDEIDLPLEAEWSEVKKRVQADPRYVNYTDSEEQLGDDYARIMYKKSLKPKKDFENCSSQSSSPQTGQEIYSSW